MNATYVHSKPWEQYIAAAGSYTIEAERRVEFEGRDLLYVKAHGVFDSTCCGVGGCGYVFVPGFILSWKSTVNDEGKEVSEVEPITDDVLRQRLTEKLAELESVNQVSFL